MSVKRDSRRSGMSRPQLAVAAVVAVLALALAGLAFAGMFTAVRTEMAPFFHGLAWIVPAGVDIGILALISAGILLEWLGMPMPALRWIAMIFMGASVWLNVAAAHGNTTGEVGHAALPLLFIACIEAIRHAVRHTAGMANGTVRDGIPVARWLLSPVPSFLMFRRMVLQRINSYPNAAALELGRRTAIAQLSAIHGSQWKRTSPGDLVWMLQKGVSVGDAITRVAELTGVPVPVPKITGPVPDRREDRDQDQPATFRSRTELQEQGLAILRDHAAETTSCAHGARLGVRMNNKEFARALKVSNELGGEIRSEIKDREAVAV